MRRGFLNRPCTIAYARLLDRKRVHLHPQGHPAHRPRCWLCPRHASHLRPASRHTPRLRLEGCSKLRQHADAKTTVSLHQVRSSSYHMAGEGLHSLCAHQPLAVSWMYQIVAAGASPLLAHNLPSSMPCQVHKSGAASWRTHARQDQESCCQTRPQLSTSSLVTASKGLLAVHHILQARRHGHYAVSSVTKHAKSEITALSSIGCRVRLLQEACAPVRPWLPSLLGGGHCGHGQRPDDPHQDVGTPDHIVKCMLLLAACLS